MGIAHAVLSIGCVAAILIAFGAAMQFVIEKDYRTAGRVVVIIVAFVFGLILGRLQYRLYRRWEHDLE